MKSIKKLLKICGSAVLIWIFGKRQTRTLTAVKIKTKGLKFDREEANSR